MESIQEYMTTVSKQESNHRKRSVKKRIKFIIDNMDLPFLS